MVDFPISVDNEVLNLPPTSVQLLHTLKNALRSLSATLPPIFVYQSVAKNPFIYIFTARLFIMNCHISWFYPV